MSRKLIGITGGIGAGKSVVTGYLRHLGYTVVCADEVSRKITMQGQPGYGVLKKWLGDAFFHEDGKLNRKQLADYVFGDAARTQQLNDLLHPLIVRRVFELADEAAGRCVFVDAALLIQAGMHKKTDRVWVVIADKDIRLRRVSHRDGCSENDVVRRMTRQMSDDEMSAYADAVIDNSGTIDALHTKVDELLARCDCTGEMQ